MYRRICPRCGSRNTAAIIWDMPEATPEFKEMLANKEIMFSDRKFSEISPTSHCNLCKKDFGGKYFAEPTFVSKLYFYAGGPGSRSHWVYLNVETTGRVLKYAASSGPVIDIKSEKADEAIEYKYIALDECWQQFNKDLLNCYFINWKQSYFNNDIADGIQWNLEVTFDNGKIVKRFGSNDFPPHWRKLLKLFQKYGLPDIR